MDEEDDKHVFTQDYWDARYAESERVWSGRPNERLVEHAADLPPGVALDVGCGEGADVVWLAQRGWRVTGADVSVVALARAKQHAGEAGVADGELPGAADLVSAMYVHVPDADFDRVYRRIAAAVRPGGTLLVAGHHPVERDTGLRNPRLGHLLFAPERVTRLLPAGWRVDVADAVEREVSDHGHEHDHGDHSHGQVATDTVVVAVRAAA